MTDREAIRRLAEIVQNIVGPDSEGDLVDSSEQRKARKIVADALEGE